jgi:uncharacterized protein YkwD
MAKKAKKPTRKAHKPEFDFIDFLNQQYGTRDSDGDGLTDEVEHFLGTNPRKADTDGDGMSDLAEIRAGRNPLGAGDWHDWWLPHAGNNYHPHALHPKRLLFYATSALVTKALVVLFVLGLPMTAWLSPDVLKEQAQKIIALTNDLRTGLGAPALAESPTLDRAAYAKASDMLLQQYFAHVGPDKKSLSSWLKSVGYRYAMAGENLALGFDSAEAVMKAWQASPTHYANLIDQDFTQIGVSAVSGPYQNTDTTVVAQYFGTPPAVVAPLKPAPTLTKTGPAVKGSREPAIASQKETITVSGQPAVKKSVSQSSVAVTVSPLPPFNSAKTRLWLDTPQGSTEAVARAEVVLNSPASEAQIIFSNYRLILNKDEAGVWQGQAVINNRQDLEPIVPPTLRLVSPDGAVTTHSLSWDNLQPLASSAGERYLFSRQNPSPAVAKIFGLSDWFYRFILFGAVMSLSVAVAVEIKQQKPKLIISTGSLIVLLILLLIF